MGIMYTEATGFHNYSYWLVPIFADTTTSHDNGYDVRMHFCFVEFS